MSPTSRSRCIAALAFVTTVALVPAAGVSARVHARPAGATVTPIDPDSYQCDQSGFVGFENVAGGTSLSGKIPGLTFSTTGGGAWTAGDFAAGAAAGTKYPAGPLNSEQTHWAGATGASTARIDFDNPARTFSILVTDYSDITLEAHDASGALLAKTPKGKVPDGRHMIQMQISEPTKNIKYVVLDSGGHTFSADSICTDAAGVPSPQLTLSIVDGAPQSLVTITGSGFAKNDTVDLSINNCFTGLASTNGAGDFTAPVAICSNLVSGPATITATGEKSPHLVGTANFLVHMDWPQLGLAPSRNAFNRHENALGVGNVAGLHQACTRPTAGRPTSAVVVNGVVYANSESGTVFAFNERTGKRLWFFNANGTLRAAPAVDGDRVFIASSDKSFYALDAATGKQLWKRVVGVALNRAPLFWNATLYVGDDDGDVFAIDEATGNQVWKRTLPSAVHSTLSTDGIRVFVGADNGVLYALDRLNKGKIVWSKQTGPRIRSSPTVDGSKVFVGADDGKIWAFSTSGASLWTYDTGRPVGAPPAAAHGLVFVGDELGFLDAISESDGAVYWRYNTGASITSKAAVANGIVYVASSSQKLYAVAENPNPANRHGQLLFSTPVGAEPTEITVTNGAVYVGSRDNVLYKFSR